MQFTGALDSLGVKTQQLFSSHGGFLTNPMYHRSTLAHYDETKRRTSDSQISKANENLKLSHGGPSQRQVSGINQPIKALRQSVISEWAYSSFPFSWVYISQLIPFSRVFFFIISMT